MGQSRSHLLVHSIFSPKDRRPFLRSKELRDASLLASDGGIDDRWRLGGLRSLAAAAGRKPTSFHGADGADALQFQGIGQQWP